MIRWRRRAATFWRGFLLVCLTASNVAQIAEYRFTGAFLISTAISVVWWSNANRAGHDDDPWLRWCYGIGAGSGTMVGMWAVRALYG